MDILSLTIQLAVVTGLCEAIKKSFLQECHYKYIPLLALTAGIAVCVLLFPADTVRQSVIDGIIVGLSSVGLYSAGKNTIEAIK